ncbi:MAG: helix-turn-helix domain-containing protein [Ardenticatenaceae bacterium]|nr:helix-turn-helix domain-containing protein [Ardenticatenaceae bacterium]
MSEPGHIRDYREPNHFWADNEIADTYLSQIGIYGFAVYMLLCRYANRQTAQCFPSIPTLADQLGVSEPTVKKALKQLVEAGLIRITRRFEETPEGKKVYKSNLYTLLAVQKKSQETGNGRAPVTGNGRTPGVGNLIAQGWVIRLPRVGKSARGG